MNVPISIEILSLTDPVISVGLDHLRATEVALAAKDILVAARAAYDIAIAAETSVEFPSPEFEVIRDAMLDARDSWDAAFSAYKSAAEAHDSAVRNEHESPQEQ